MSQTNQLNGTNDHASTPKPMRVSIQGYEGSFHEEAARKYFGENVQVIPCSTFKDVVKVGEDESQSDGAVMAIENSIAGSILANYNLLRKSKLITIGEIYLAIDQNLMVNPGVTLDDIKEVHSHPMALQQCLHYLDPFDWKLVEAEDTAGSAKYIHQHHSKHMAAIASRRAAELYGLDIIAPAIQTVKNNYTRFIILQPEDKARISPDANKATVNFHTDHSRGALAKVLTAIAEAGINLSKLQSFPKPESEWQYTFHADMEFENLYEFNNVMKVLQHLTEEVKVYGIYKRGDKAIREKQDSITADSHNSL